MSWPCGYTGLWEGRWAPQTFGARLNRVRQYNCGSCLVNGKGAAEACVKGLSPTSWLRRQMDGSARLPGDCKIGVHTFVLTGRGMRLVGLRILGGGPTGVDSRTASLFAWAGEFSCRLFPNIESVIEEQSLIVAATLGGCPILRGGGTYHVSTPTRGKGWFAWHPSEESRKYGRRT
jgi:hypothetical protein